MSLKVVSFRLSENVLNFLRKSKFFGTTYDRMVSEIINECEKVIDQVSDFTVETLSVQTFKLSQETIEKLDMIAKRHNMSRSEAFRKLIIAKADGLC